jgi:hypothetical protein
MTDKTDREIMQQALDALIENARLLGITQAKRGYGFYSQEDAIFERALRIALDLEELHIKAKKRAKKEAALSWPEGNNRKRMQEELTDRYFYEYTGGQK